MCIWEGKRGEGRQKVEETGGWKLIVSTAKVATKMQSYVDYGDGICLLQFHESGLR